jgi:hypothetical protein
MAIVYERELHAGIVEIRGQVGLPDSFGEPQPSRIGTEPVLEGLVHPLHLCQAINTRERGENRFVESRQQQLDASITGEFSDVVQERRFVLVQPLDERAGDVQCDREERLRLYVFKERPIHLSHVLFKDVAEIANRLVQVEPETETNRIAHPDAPSAWGESSAKPSRWRRSSSSA